MTESNNTPNQPNQFFNASIEAKPTYSVTAISRSFLDSALSGPAHDSPSPSATAPTPELKPTPLHRIANPTKAHPGAVSPVMIAALTLAALATGLGAREITRNSSTQAAAVHTTNFYRIPATNPVITPNPTPDNAPDCI